MLTPVVENIIVKYLNKEATSLELETLDLWLKDEAHLEIFKSYVKTKHLIDANNVKFDTDKSKKQLLNLILKDKKLIRVRTYYRIMGYAALFVISLTIGFIFKEEIFLRNDQDSNHSTTVVESSIKAGTNSATLTLEDGSQVILNKGKSYQQANVESNGESLIYQNEVGKAPEVVYNFLTVPRGGQFFVQLSDGTKVWLNSESQLKYPKQFFSDKPRHVELIYGEAYFEVSPSTAHNGTLFRVISKNQTIEVLGTQFNLKAYQDEQVVYTTLVEGEIALEHNHQKKILKPNDQAIVVGKHGEIIITTVEIDSEISWRDGLFSFKGKPLEDIMNVLARWYNMNVIFENSSMKKDLFGGSFSKDQELTEVLKMIENATTATFEIKDRTIIIK